MRKTIQDIIKTALVAGAASGLLALSACNAGNGSIEGCATALYGTFEGHTGGQGLISAYLMEDGTLEATFLEPDDTPDDATDNLDRQAVMMALEDGTLEPDNVGALTISNATMDYDTCEASGDWDIFGQEMGTWTLGRYDSSPF